MGRISQTVEEEPGICSSYKKDSIKNEGAKAGKSLNQTIFSTSEEEGDLVKESVSSPRQEWLAVSSCSSMFPRIWN